MRIFVMLNCITCLMFYIIFSKKLRMFQAEPCKTVFGKFRKYLFVVFRAVADDRRIYIVSIKIGIDKQVLMSTLVKR